MTNVIDESLYIDSFGFCGFSKYTLGETFYKVVTIASQKGYFEFGTKNVLSIELLSGEYLEMEFDGHTEALSEIKGFPNEICSVIVSVFTTFFDVKTKVVLIISSSEGNYCSIVGILYLDDILTRTSSVVKAIKSLSDFMTKIAKTTHVQYLVAGLDGYLELWNEDNFLCSGLVGVYEKDMIEKILGDDKYQSFFENIPIQEIDGYLLIWSLEVEAFLRGERITNFIENKFLELSKLYDQAYPC